MDFDKLLEAPPCSSLDPAIREYIASLFPKDAGPIDPVELAEVLGPYLVDSDLVADEEKANALCLTLAVQAGASPHKEGSKAAKDGHVITSTVSGGTPACLGAVDSATAWELAAAPGALLQSPAIEHDEMQELAGGAKARVSRKEKKASAVRAAATIEAALANSSSEFRLKEPESTATSAGISHAIQSGFRHSLDAENIAASADFLAAAFTAYAKEPQRVSGWCRFLDGILEESSTKFEQVEEEDKNRILDNIIREIVRKDIMEAVEKMPECGSIVLAVLPEDDSWHLAIVEQLSKDGELQIVFLEYGKPLKVHFKDTRFSEIGDDEGAEEQDGSCEMCKCQQKLTFHHLIPKDTHPTYLKNRLPKGIQGEPTRGFLNTYGLMICRKCHNMVHSIAPNSVLAVEYNTLDKIMAHPTIQRWVEWKANTGWKANKG